MLYFLSRVGKEYKDKKKVKCNSACEHLAKLQLKNAEIDQLQHYISNLESVLEKKEQTVLNSEHSSQHNASVILPLIAKKSVTCPPTHCNSNTKTVSRRHGTQSQNITSHQIKSMETDNVILNTENVVDLLKTNIKSDDIDEIHRIIAPVSPILKEKDDEWLKHAESVLKELDDIE